MILRTLAIAYLVGLMVFLPALRGDAANPASNAQSQALTNYLHRHRLPLVGAELIPHPGGKPQLVLFGFTATNFGKHDAVTKARRFLHNAPVTVTNRIIVRPELLSLKAPVPAARLHGGSATASNNEISAYENQAQQQYAQQQYAQQQYANQGAGSTLSTVLPLLGIGAAILGLGMGFGNFEGGIGMPFGYYGQPGYGPPGPGYAPYGPPPPPGYPPYAPPPGGYGVFP
ncbi:MAG TPA: hypothetical protein VKV28_08320 [Candidatus Binataceae bacterium]|nr:hypothetical protein [Candidatus Binataceae bacterium]